MQELKEKILKEGKIKPGNIVKVDSFLNHQVDVEFMRKIGEEFYNYFKDKDVNKILTIESSGIPVAFAAAEYFKCKIVFAKKGETINQSSDFYQSDVFSYTYQRNYHVRVAKEYLNENDKVLIIDDFLANGAAMEGLLNIVNQAKAKVVGCGIVIEKGFQDGGRKLREKGINLLSLAIVDKIDVDNQKIEFRGE